MSQIMEQDKTPEEQLCEVETGNFLAPIEGPDPGPRAETAHWMSSHPGSSLHQKCQEERPLSPARSPQHPLLRNFNMHLL